MVESREDDDVKNPDVEEHDLGDHDSPAEGDPAAEGSLGAGGSPGGPEVPEQGTENPGNSDKAGGSDDMPGGPASGTDGNTELKEDNVPPASADMLPGQNFGIPNITDGSWSGRIFGGSGSRARPQDDAAALLRLLHRCFEV